MDPDLKEWVKRNSYVVKKEERFSVYELNTTTLREDEEQKIREVSVGPKNDLEVKTVLLVGESGAGKTTFLNAFLNVVFGVDIDDDVRLQLKEQSPPCHTSLLIHHQKGMPYPFNYKVVDTLGLGDDDHDDQVNQKALKDYLSNQEAISDLNCVALVWKSSSRRLDERSQAILFNVKHLMSHDLQSLTDVLLTFSPHDDSSAVGAIEDSGVLFQKVFHFENAALYQCPSNESRQKIHAMIWSSMVENQKRFLKELNQRRPKSLTDTAKLYTTQAKLEVSQKRSYDLEKELNPKEKHLKDQKAWRNSLEEKEAEINSKVLPEPTHINEDNDEYCSYCKPDSGDNNSVSSNSYASSRCCRIMFYGIRIALSPIFLSFYALRYVWRYFASFLSPGRENKSYQKCSHCSSIQKARDEAKKQRDAVLKEKERLKKEKELLEEKIEHLEMEVTQLREEKEKEERISKEKRELISKLQAGS